MDLARRSWRSLDRLPGRHDPALWPADAIAAQNLLDFFLLEKAFYEMEYELMNRPAWLRVPLDGTWRILARHNVVPPEPVQS